MRRQLWCISTVVCLLGLSGTVAQADGVASLTSRSGFVSPGSDFPGSRTLDGSRNNLSHGSWGQAGFTYSRAAAPNYADAASAPRTGPAARYVSNRVFNDLGQNIFSENGV